MIEKVVEIRMIELFCQAYVGKIKQNKGLFYTKESFEVLNNAIDSCSSILSLEVIERAFDYMENEMKLF